MIKTSAAYSKLAPILGSRLVNRRRTIHEEGQPAKIFSETLLLIPKLKASAIGVPDDAEVYIDKTTREEFIAVRVSATKPRSKVPVPAPPRNPMLEWRPVLGQGGLYEGKEIWIVCPTHDVRCSCREVMAQAFVRIVRCCPLSEFKYGQVVSQQEAYEENERLDSAFAALRKTGCEVSTWVHFLSFVAATEADSVRLVQHHGDDVVILTSMLDVAKSEHADDSSVHSTISLNAVKPVDRFMTDAGRDFLSGLNIKW